MDEILSSLLPLGLAIYSILLIIKSWSHKKTAIMRIVAVAVGAGLGILTLGWPAGLITGLAAAAVGPFLFKRLENTVPGSPTTHEEKEENGPPVAVSPDNRNEEV